MGRSNLGFLGSLLGFLIAFVIGSGSAVNPPEGAEAFPAVLLAACAVYLLGIWTSQDVNPPKAAILAAVALMSLGIALLFGVPLYPGIDGHFLGIMFAVPSALLMLAALYQLLLLSHTVLPPGRE